MSLEEDTELRDLVVKSLESNGILAKLKAQLRASIFIALEEENSIKEKVPYGNNKLKDFLEHRHGKLILFLIKDFLEFFDLDYTKSVFEAEACLNDFVTPIDHTEISKEFNIEVINNNEPLLYNLILHKSFHQKLNEKRIVITENRLSEQISTETESITPKPITQIRTSIKNINNKTFTNLENVNITSDMSIESSVISDQENTSNKDSIVEDHPSIEPHCNVDEKFLIDFEKSLKYSSHPENHVEHTPLNLLDETINKMMCSSPMLSDKLENRNEKIKPFSSLSSLQDLPPLSININKNRNEAILLPSLYSRDISDNRKDNSDSQSCDESIDMDNVKSHSS